MPTSGNVSSREGLNPHPNPCTVVTGWKKNQATMINVSKRFIFPNSFIGIVRQSTYFYVKKLPSFLRGVRWKLSSFKIRFSFFQKRADAFFMVFRLPHFQLAFFFTLQHFTQISDIFLVVQQFRCNE